MKVLKGTISVAVSVVISASFFDLNVWATLLVYCLISMIIMPSKDKWLEWRKQKIYYVCLAICIMGGILLILGRELIKNDFITVLGAMMFATTFAGILVKDYVVYKRG